MPFSDHIPFKGSLEEEKDESKDEAGCRRFVIDHIKDCEKVLKKLEDANLIFSREKSCVEHMAENRLQPKWMLSKR